MTIYEVTARRSGKWWALEVPALPGVFSQCKRLDQTEQMARDAIATVTDLPADSFDVVVTPIVDGSLGEAVRGAIVARDAAGAAREAATASIRAAVTQAADEGLPLRDAAALVGISYQYAAKVTTARHQRSA